MTNLSDINIIYLHKVSKLYKINIWNSVLYEKEGEKEMSFHQKPHTFVSQVALRVNNILKSLRFYEEVLGFQVLTKSSMKAVLTADGKTPLVTLEQLSSPEPKQERKTGLYHFALLLPSRAALGEIIRHLVKTGYPVQGASDHLVSEAIYLADPDGNGIEIYRDRSDANWEWNDDEVKMATLPLDAQAVLAEATNEKWEGLPAHTVMGHIHLHVADLEETRAFYEKLGFDVVSSFPNQALFMSTGRYHHHIGVNIWNGRGANAPSEKSPGMKYFTIEFPDEEKREVVVDRLKDIGAVISKEDQAIFTKDPSQNQIKLVVQ